MGPPARLPGLSRKRSVPDEDVSEPREQVVIFDWDSKETMFSASVMVKHARDGEVWLQIDGKDQMVVVQEGQWLTLEWQKPRYVFHGMP